MSALRRTNFADSSDGRQNLPPRLDIEAPQESDEDEDETYEDGTPSDEATPSKRLELEELLEEELNAARVRMQRNYVKSLGFKTNNILGRFDLVRQKQYDVVKSHIHLENAHPVDLTPVGDEDYAKRVAATMRLREQHARSAISDLAALDKEIRTLSDKIQDSRLFAAYKAPESSSPSPLPKRAAGSVMEADRDSFFSVGDEDA